MVIDCRAHLTPEAFLDTTKNYLVFLNTYHMLGNILLLVLLHWYFSFTVNLSFVSLVKQKSLRPGTCKLSGQELGFYSLTQRLPVIS